MRIAIIGYIIVAVAVFWGVLLPQDGQMIFGDDIHRQYYFYRQFFNDWVRQGVFPWWNPYLFGGEPFIANPVVNIWYPPNWLFSILPLNIAYSWHIFVHIVFAMTGMYVLLMKHMGNTKPAGGAGGPGAWIGGAVFGLSGFFMARTFAGHVDVIAAASWMPWVVGAYIGDFHRKTTTTLFMASGLFALQLLSGYQTMAFFTVIAVGFAAIIRSMETRSITPVFRAVMAGFGGIGLAAFHLIPVAEFFRQSIRTYAFPYAWHAYGALEWRSLVQFIDPFRFGNQFTYAGPPPNFIEHSAFIGIGGLLVSAWGVVSVFRKKLWTGLALIVVTVFGIWVSLGPNAPVDLQYLLWKIVPMYRNLRIPPRHLILVVFGAAGLAGIGFNAIFRRLPGSLRIPLGGITALVLVVELVVFARTFIGLKPVPETRHDSGLIADLKSDMEPYRLLQNFGVWLPQRDTLDFDSVMSYGIHSATGYDPSILRSYYEYVATSTGKRGSELVTGQDVQVPYLTQTHGEALDTLNIKYILVPQAYDPFTGNKRYKLLRDDHEDKYRLYENTTVKPRFYLSDPSCGSVHMDSYTPNRIDLAVDSRCDATLMSSEIWYPGWDAYVDGKKVRINKEKDVFRTIFVSSGKHTVSYRYAPRIFVIGVMITLVTVLLFARYLGRLPFNGVVRPASI